MNIITGFIEPTEGQVLIDGYNISKKPNKAKEQIGYMPEGVPLYTDLTVKEFITYMAELKKIDKKTKKAKVEKIIEQTGLKDRHYCRTPSSVSKRLCAFPAFLLTQGSFAMSLQWPSNITWFFMVSILSVCLGKLP